MLHIIHVSSICDIYTLRICGYCTVCVSGNETCSTDATQRLNAHTGCTFPCAFDVYRTLDIGHEPDQGSQRALRVERQPGRVLPHMEGRLHHQVCILYVYTYVTHVYSNACDLSMSRGVVCLARRVHHPVCASLVCMYSTLVDWCLSAYCMKHYTPARARAPLFQTPKHAVKTDIPMDIYTYGSMQHRHVGRAICIC
jgi:hypothetical protein